MSTQDAPTIPIEQGALIDEKYRVDRVLGAGGMGVVMAATHVDLDRLVAVKLIREELAEDDAVVERLMLEARAAAKINSNHVGKVLDVGKLENGVPYIVMEHLEGVDLCQMLESHGALPIMDSVDYVLQACEALAEAHLASIVHRDLKPENLFVTRLPDGAAHIKVLDFGISKQLGDSSRRQLTNPSSAVGSPQYMAPEQMQAADVDVRADVWALGAILYELISNRPAFEGSTLPEICVKVMGEQPIPLSQHAPHVPDALAAIITRCLEKDREKRFATVAELVEELAPFGSQRSVQSRNRIAGLLSGGAFTVAGQQTANQASLGSGATQVATTPGGGLEVPVAGSGSQSGTSFGTQTPARNVSRWPVFAGLGAVVVVGAGLWVLATDPPSSSDSAADVAAASAALGGQDATPVPTTLQPTDPEPATAGASTAPLADSATSPSDAGSEDASDVSTSVSPVPTLPSAASTRVAPITKPKPPKPRRPSPPRARVAPQPPKADPPKEKPASDAWDPDNFGGRH